MIVSRAAWPVRSVPMAQVVSRTAGHRPNLGRVSVLVVTAARAATCVAAVVDQIRTE